MVTVGVRELKNQLSRFLRLVQDGELVLVTDHGRVIAMLLAGGELQGREVQFAALAKSGAIRLPLVDGDPLADWPKARGKAPAGLARALIDEDRGDSPNR